MEASSADNHNHNPWAMLSDASGDANEGENISNLIRSGV